MTHSFPTRRSSDLGSVTILSGGVVNVFALTALKGNSSGNPMLVTAASAGQMLWSAAVNSVIVKAISTNTLDLFLGGAAAGDKPYSGNGFVLSPGEGINLPVDNVGRIYACAALSGEKITWLGVV